MFLKMPWRWRISENIWTDKKILCWRSGYRLTFTHQSNNKYNRVGGFPPTRFMVTVSSHYRANCTWVPNVRSCKHGGRLAHYHTKAREAYMTSPGQLAYKQYSINFYNEAHEQTPNASAILHARELSIRQHILEVLSVTWFIVFLHDYKNIRCILNLFAYYVNRCFVSFQFFTLWYTR